MAWYSCHLYRETPDKLAWIILDYNDVDGLVVTDRGYNLISLDILMLTWLPKWLMFVIENTA